MKNIFINVKSILICFCSQTVSNITHESKTESETPNATTSTPKTTLTRTSTYHGVTFTVPLEQINVEVDETSVEVKRTITHTQPVSEILDELPDSIKEIVAATIYT